MSELERSEWAFSITGLGNLDKGEISVKPLTLLCGPNNTGKTWVMYSIYGFLNSSDIEPIHSMEDIISELKENGILEVNFNDWLQKNFKQAVSSIERTNKERFHNLFSTNEEFFSKTSFKWKANQEKILDRFRESRFEYSISLGSKSANAFTAKKLDDEPTISMTLLKDVPKDILRRYISSIFFNIIQDKNNSTDKSFLIPAERNGLHLFYRELSSRRTALLHHASQEKLDLATLLKDVLGSRYAKPIADYIDWLNELTTIKKGAKKTDYHDLAEEVKKLVGGRYHIDTDGNITFTPKKKRGGPETQKMDLHLSSSTVKSLFGLWFYLEYQASNKNVLMIDEPELNLHPSNQRAVARLIAKMVNKGLNIVLSTHSDYLVKELNSLIMLGGNEGNPKKKQELLKRFSIDEASLLNKEQIGAYVFSNGTLTEMKVNSEGIMANTFDDQINELNDSSDEIYYSYVLNEKD